MLGEKNMVKSVEEEAVSGRPVHVPTEEISRKVSEALMKVILEYTDTIETKVTDFVAAAQAREVTEGVVKQAAEALVKATKEMASTFEKEFAKGHLAVSLPQTATGDAKEEDMEAQMKCTKKANIVEKEVPENAAEAQTRQATGAVAENSADARVRATRNSTDENFTEAVSEVSLNEAKGNLIEKDAETPKKIAKGVAEALIQKRTGISDSHMKVGEKVSGARVSKATDGALAVKSTKDAAGTLQKDGEKASTAETVEDIANSLEGELKDLEDPILKLSIDYKRARLHFMQLKKDKIVRKDLDEKNIAEDAIATSASSKSSGTRLTSSVLLMIMLWVVMSVFVMQSFFIGSV